jgi:hypothetical protein
MRRDPFQKIEITKPTSIETMVVLISGRAVRIQAIKNISSQNRIENLGSNNFEPPEKVIPDSIS